MRHAIELDPLSATMNARLGMLLHWSGQNEQAVIQIRKSIDLDPLLADAHFFLAMAYDRLGRYDEAVAEYLESDRLSGIDQSIVTDFRRAYAISGIDGFRRRKLDSERQQIASGQANYFLMAKLAADLGDTNAAFRWLEMAYQQHDVRITNIKVAASLRSLNGDPRFADLLRRIGIP
jgi:tetratricopeptide (TPR) repeat protein